MRNFMMNWTRTIAAIPLTLAGLAAVGCADRPLVTYVPEHGTDSRSADDVEVLLDRQPEKPFTVTGEFFAHTASSERSIALIKQRAMAVGLDGIYYIDCDSTFHGECSAKGYVYRDDEAVALASATRSTH